MRKTLYAYWAGVEVETNREVFEICPDPRADTDWTCWLGYSERRLREEVKRWRRRGYSVIYSAPPSILAEDAWREKQLLEFVGLPPETLH